MDFYRFFSIFPDSNCISDNALPIIWYILSDKLKIWYVLFSSYYDPGLFDLNKTIKVHPQDVVCRLGTVLWTEAATGGVL